MIKPNNIRFLVPFIKKSKTPAAHKNPPNNSERVIIINKKGTIFLNGVFSIMGRICITWGYLMNMWNVLRYFGLISLFKADLRPILVKSYNIIPC